MTGFSPGAASNTIGSFSRARSVHEHGFAIVASMNDHFVARLNFGRRGRNRFQRTRFSPWI